MFKTNIAVRFKMRHGNHHEGFSGSALTKEGSRKEAERQMWFKSDILNIRHGSSVAIVLSKKEFDSLDTQTQQTVKNDWRI